MKVALYARVSTSDQNCELQLKELREFCERKGWEIYGEYVDAGVSGKKASRPRLNDLKEHARLAHFQTVIVWKLDRWGRSLSDCVNSIQDLSALGIRFLAVTQNIDTDESNPMWRLMLHLLAAFSEFERELIRERVRAGVKTRQGKGLPHGRRRVVFDRKRADWLLTQGYSIREIAADLEVSKGVVQRWKKTVKI